MDGGLTDGHIPDLRTIEDTVLRLLADEQHRDPDTYVADMRSRGNNLEVDSLLIIEVLVVIETTFNVTLPADAITARVLRSVTTLAQHLRQLMITANAMDASA